ncbi:MAG: polyphenol oxidase family protein [Planctomycetota bacterium]|nr:polyphenol oxidase family protein [Planctomycetota bacterium]
MRGLESFAALRGVPGLVHGLTTRAVARADLAAGLGLGSLITAQQVHGPTVAVVEQDGPPGEADGLATDQPGLLLGVLGADCPGVLLVAPGQRALAVVHAGWRGVVAGVVSAALDLLSQRYDVAPQDLRVAIGAGIGAPRYEVSTDVAAAIAMSVEARWRDYVISSARPGHAHADLRAAIRAQLVARGVSDAHIETHPSCTYDDARFFSYRREGPSTGRHLLVAGWQPDEPAGR